PLGGERRAQLAFFAAMRSRATIQIVESPGFYPFPRNETPTPRDPYPWWKGDLHVRPGKSACRRGDVRLLARLPGRCKPCHRDLASADAAAGGPRRGRRRNPPWRPGGRAPQLAGGPGA